MGFSREGRKVSLFIGLNKHPGLGSANIVPIMLQKVVAATFILSHF